MTLNNNKILKKITLSSLVSLPEVLLHLLAVLGRPGNNPEYEEIAAIMRNDPPLCARALDLAYPAHITNPKRLASLAEVLSEIGLDSLKTLVHATAVNQVFYRAGETAQSILSRGWWRWVRAAHVARALAERVNYAAPDEAYLAVLVADIGRLALAANWPVAYQAFLNDETDLAEAEKERLHFGMTMDAATNSIVGHLNIASFMADALRYKGARYDRLVTAHRLVQIVYLAIAIATCVDAGEPLPFASAEELLALGAADVEHLVAVSADEMAKAATLLGVPDKATSPDVLTLEKLKRVRLANEVREIGLLSRMRPNFSGLKDEAAVFGALRKTLHILFDFTHPIFFRHDQESAALMGVALPGQSDLVNQLSVFPTASNSLIAEAFRNKEALHSSLRGDVESASILDDQIIRLTGQDGILCLPLVAKAEVVGMIALGLAREQLPRLEPQLKLLTALSAQAGLALASSRRRESLMAGGETSADGVAVSASAVQKAVRDASNPLEIIKNYVKILRLKLADGESTEHDLAIIDDEIDRASAILRSLVDPATKKRPPLPS